MPHSLAISLGVSFPQAMAILAVLGSEGVCANRLLIYHNCEPGVPFGSVPFGAGFPTLPWICPNCESEVEDYSELAFDVEAVTAHSVELI